MKKTVNKYNSLSSAIKKYCREKGIIKVISAISGGADSIALTHLLKEIGLEITALHCNFHLREEESNRDQNFVEDFCQSYDIELRIKQFNVKEFLTANPGKSIEMACRELRYEWFYEILFNEKFDRLAIGHNADDNIETFFLNLLRGAGVKGLKGMDPDTGIIWRPLLKTHRKDILHYLYENGLTYITDSSNLCNDYRRNYLRNIIIPELRSEWRGFDKALDHSLNYLYSGNKIIENAIEKVLPVEGKGLPVKTILEFPDPSLIIRRYIESLDPFTTTSEEILSSIKASKPHSRTWNLRKGKVILRNNELRKYYEN